MIDKLSDVPNNFLWFSLSRLVLQPVQNMTSDTENIY